MEPLICRAKLTETAEGGAEAAVAQAASARTVMGWELLNCGDGDVGGVHAERLATKKESITTEDVVSSCSSSSSRRRCFLAQVWLAAAAAAVAPLIGHVPAAAAAAPGGGGDEGGNASGAVGRRIMRGLGFGDADVYYPRIFEGEWDCLSQLVAVELPQGESVVDLRSVTQSRRVIGLNTGYKARFFNYKGDVVGDRAFTTTSLVDSSMGEGTVVDADWSPDRPDAIKLTLKGGYKVQSLITRRSFELSAPNQFDVSEFSKQVFDNSSTVDGPPSVKASSNLTRYRWDLDEDTGRVEVIEAFQRVAMYPVVGGVAGSKEGGLTATDVISLGFGEKPVTVYKYLLRLTRAS